MSRPRPDFATVYRVLRLTADNWSIWRMGADRPGPRRPRYLSCCAHADLRHAYCRNLHPRRGAMLAVDQLFRPGYVHMCPTTHTWAGRRRRITRDLLNGDVPFFAFTGSAHSAAESSTGAAYRTSCPNRPTHRHLSRLRAAGRTTISSGDWLIQQSRPSHPPDAPMSRNCQLERAAGRPAPTKQPRPRLMAQACRIVRQFLKTWLWGGRGVGGRRGRCGAWIGLNHEGTTGALRLSLPTSIRHRAGIVCSSPRPSSETPAARSITHSLAAAGRAHLSNRGLPNPPRPWVLLAFQPAPLTCSKNSTTTGGALGPTRVSPTSARHATDIITDPPSRSNRTSTWSAGAAGCIPVPSRDATPGSFMTTCWRAPSAAATICCDPQSRPCLEAVGPSAL